MDKLNRTNILNASTRAIDGTGTGRTSQTGSDRPVDLYE